jgi:hypothetical protein
MPTLAELRGFVDGRPTQDLVRMVQNLIGKWKKRVGSAACAYCFFFLFFL